MGILTAELVVLLLDMLHLAVFLLVADRPMEMPKLKVLRLEDNKIADKGVSCYSDNLKKDQLNSTCVSFTSSKIAVEKMIYPMKKCWN